MTRTEREFFRTARRFGVPHPKRFARRAVKHQAAKLLPGRLVSALARNLAQGLACPVIR